MKLACLGYSLIGVVICSVPSATFARPDQKMEALRHYDHGLSLMKDKAYGEAIAEFNQSYDLEHDFAVLRDIGKAYIAIDQPVFAVKALKQYLGEGGKKISGAERKPIEDQIAEQERRIATVTIQTAQDGAIIRVDGIEMGKTPLSEGILVNAGSHLFTVSVVGNPPWEQRLALAGGERRILEIRFESSGPVAVTPLPPVESLIPVSAATPPTALPASPSQTEASAPVQGVATQGSPPTPSSPGRGRTVAYVVGGLGVGALIVGGVFGARANSKRHDSDKLCPQDQCSQAGLDLNDQAKTSARFADITIGAGLVSVAIATYLLLRSPKSEASPSTTSAQGTRLLAQVGPGEARLALGGSW